MSDSLYSLVFQSSVALQSILFGVFGFLYSVYAMYSSLATEEQPVRAPICSTLKWLCRLMATLIIVSAILALVPIYFLTVASPPGKFLAWGLAVPIVAMAVISTWMAFFKME